MNMIMKVVIKILKATGVGRNADEIILVIENKGVADPTYRNDPKFSDKQV